MGDGEIDGEPRCGAEVKDRKKDRKKEKHMNDEGENTLC